MTRRAWAGTIVVHAIVIALLAWCLPPRAVEDAVGVAVELFAPPPVAAAAAAPVTAAAAATAAAPAAAPATATAVRGRGRAPGPVSAIESEIRGGGGSGSGSGSGGGGGSGSGSGSGGGGGLGGGLGGPPPSAALPDIPPPKPIPTIAEPPPSKARPARLIWPVRNRAERDGEVFIVHLHVDADGYVTGVRLVQGVGHRHDDSEAEAGVWRFRYAPALDDAGNPIASAFDQKLMLD